MAVGLMPLERNRYGTGHSIVFLCVNPVVGRGLGAFDVLNGKISNRENLERHTNLEQVRTKSI